MAKKSSGSVPKLAGKFSHVPKVKSNPGKGTIGNMGRPPATATKVKGNR